MQTALNRAEPSCCFCEKKKKIPALTTFDREQMHTSLQHHHSRSDFRPNVQVRDREGARWTYIDMEGMCVTIRKEHHTEKLC